MSNEIIFSNGLKKIKGREVTWDELPEVVEEMYGDIDQHYEGTVFVEIGAFNGVFMESDFKMEKIFALANGMILTAGELEEKGFDWS